MATEYGTADTDIVEAEEIRPRRRQELSYDEALAPNCMLWGMIIGLGAIAVILIVWIFSEGLKSAFG